MATCSLYYNPALCTYSDTSQTVAAGDALSFDNNKLLTGTAITHSAGSTTATISKKGIYYISIDADILPVAAGDIEVQICNNGVALPDATATFTGTATSTTHIHLDTVQQVLPSCCAISNIANITVTVSAAAIVSNAKIIIF